MIDEDSSDGSEGSDVLDFFARSLTELAGQDRIGVIAIPAPIAPVEALLRCTPRAYSFIWQPPKGPVISGSGVCARIDVEGPERFTQLRVQSDALLQQVHRYDYPGTAAPNPRLFGGLAFSPNSVAEPWQEFGDGCFTLPRWSYTRTAERAYLSLATRGTEDAGVAWRAALMAELENLLYAIGAAAWRVESMPPPPPTSRKEGKIRQLDFAIWKRQIDDIREAIAGGTFEKIVAARRCEVEFERPVDDIELMARIGWEMGTVRFCFRREGGAFLGASPETLFDKHGDVLLTEALAGTIRSLGSDAPRLSGQSDQLLGSSKDLGEHAVVVREIRESLAPLSVEITIHDPPQIRRVREILHLNTAISATLHKLTHAADLLEALHPTPAVGGAPTREATKWIVEHEPHGRGWYAGTVGWIDTAGDATFAVAIRSGLISGTSAFIFTGAGIVHDSDAEAEYAETALKQQPFLRALGAAG